MSKDSPIWLRLTGAISLMLLITWSGMIMWETRVNHRTVKDQAKDFAFAINEMTMAGLTGMMITGTVDRREVFLDQIKELSSIKELEVIRGEAVSKLYGPGKADRTFDEIERLAMETREPIIKEERGPEGSYLRAVIPALASKKYLGKDCTVCHGVEEGTPLGAVSMRISLQRVNEAVARFRDESILFAIVVTLPLLGFVYYFTQRFVTRPLFHLSRSLSEISRGGGDLTRRLKAEKHDEIGQAADSFNQMLGTITTLLRQVNDAALAVARHARNMTVGAEKIADSSHRQTNSSIQAAQAVEELNINIGSVVDGTDTVRTVSHDSLDRSLAGQLSLKQLVNEMGQVQESVGRMDASLKDFFQSTQSISNITKEVREIAEQTNLLALNAAIEAARAGEQGRGFAVVADEVRKLAEKSAHSAGQIDSITQDISKRSASVQDAVRTGLNYLASSCELANNVSVVLDSANERVKEVGNGLDRIAETTEEQNTVSASVKESLDAIAKMARDNDSAIETTAAAAHEMERLSAQLQETVSRFKF